MDVIGAYLWVVVDSKVSSCSRCVSCVGSGVVVGTVLGVVVDVEDEGVVVVVLDECFH